MIFMRISYRSIDFSGVKYKCWLSWVLNWAHKCFREEYWWQEMGSSLIANLKLQKRHRYHQKSLVLSLILQSIAVIPHTQTHTFYSWWNAYGNKKVVSFFFPWHTLLYCCGNNCCSQGHEDCLASVLTRCSDIRSRKYSGVVLPKHLTMDFR